MTIVLMALRKMSWTWKVKISYLAESWEQCTNNDHNNDVLHDVDHDDDNAGDDDDDECQNN